jgi:ATPase subunit of ABC transporter with duplicated ATPase domains
VSHDRGLLDLVDRVYELHERGITVYGGGFDFYCEQKAQHENALREALRAKEHILKREERGMREALESKNKQDARGKVRKQRSGVPRIAMKKLKDTAEASTRRMKEAHSGRLDTLRGEVARTREQLPVAGTMKLDFASSNLHRGKILIDAADINYFIDGRPLWAQPVSLRVRSGQRLRIRGANGSGKTTLIRLLLGELAASEGELHRAPLRSVYIDQDYSLIRPGRTVFEQARSFNHTQLPEHELRIILNRFLFDATRLDKDCGTLSGGERMRLLLCCMMIAAKAPDVFVLDEPTNNLDMRNADILLDAIRDYEGTMLLVSHDEHFVRALGVEEELVLERHSAPAFGTRSEA